jgi:3-hydroxybutyryl-CoA dehydratase
MQIEIGPLASFTRTFTQTDYDRCAQLTGDDNPIHVDPEFAKTTRWGRTLAHGMLLYGVISAAISSRLRGTIQVEQKLKFPGPTFTGEEMSIRLEVIGVDEDDGSFVVAGTIARPGGEAACESTTRVRFSS